MRPESPRRHISEGLAKRLAKLGLLASETFVGFPSLPFALVHLRGREVRMGIEQKPDADVPTKDSDVRDARRKRRLARATEAFQKRAAASERRWLAGLGGGKPKR